MGESIKQTGFGVDAREQGVSWGLIAPLRMPSLLPHDLCHGRSSSHWPPAIHCLNFIAFLPRNKCLLTSWLQSPSAVNLETKKIKSVIVSSISPSICHEVMGPHAMILVFWMLSFKPAFSLSSFTFGTSLLAEMVKGSAYNVGDLGLIPGLGRSPGEGNGNPLQYSCLENPMGGGTW